MLEVRILEYDDLIDTAYFIIEETPRMTHVRSISSGFIINHVVEEHVYNIHVSILYN